jgi:hypothetical protein
MTVHGVDPLADPSGAGCVECEAGQGTGWWYHLCRCAQCGHIGCCDSSPLQHAEIYSRVAAGDTFGSTGPCGRIHGHERAAEVAPGAGPFSVHGALWGAGRGPAPWIENRGS